MQLIGACRDKKELTDLKYLGVLVHGAGCRILVVLLVGYTCWVLENL
jgi:hypothetical protein